MLCWHFALFYFLLIMKLTFTLSFKLPFTLCLALFVLNASASQQPLAEFLWFEYQGKDTIFADELKKDHYSNPIIAGYYPDPSVVRVGNDYYLVNSSFAYFPGLPVFHSKDLVNWQQIGHALNRRSQLTFENGQSMSHGIFAPTIRYHDGLFYIITTDVYGIGNFYITAENPAGPWSDPVILPEIGGIDPDLFFDDDGRVYIAHNNGPKGEPLYDGHRAIWLWEYDLKNKKVIKESGRVIVNGGVDITKKPIWIEGPHLYKVNGWYYLSCAEGGTAEDHSQVIFRAKTLDDPFVPYEHNPILTQRDLPANRSQPVTSTGHADFVQTPNGDWWAVFLGIRPYFDSDTQSWHHNTGRETFLLPVTWKEGWPTILAHNTAVPLQVAKPRLKSAQKNVSPQSGNFLWRDDFDEMNLQLNWVKLRTSATDWHSINTQKSTLQLVAQTHSLSEKVQPSYLGRRQQHQNFSAHTEVVLPTLEGLTSGLALFQNSAYHYFLGVSRHGETFSLRLEATLAGKTSIVQEKTLTPQKSTLVLGVTQQDATLTFFYIDDRGRKQFFLRGIPASNISTQTAGGFIGVTMGPHARVQAAAQ